jgi:hypothetical protein
MEIQIDTLRALLPRGAAVYTVVTHESRTGTNCRILLLAIAQGEIVSVTAAAATLTGLAVEHGHAQISESRAHAGRLFVERVAVALHQDARSLKHRSLG